MFFYKPFEPNQIPGCQLWLDSQDTRTLTFSSSNIVQQWNDKSGNNRHFTQVTVASQPTWNPATGLTFDGVNDTLLSPATFPIGVFTKIFVVKTSAVGFLASQGSDCYIWTNSGSTFEVGKPGVGTSGKNISGGWLNNNKLKNVFWTFGGTHATNLIYVNGVLRTSTNSVIGEPGTGTITGQISLMSRASSSHLAGNLYEVCIFGRVLTSDEIKLMMVYMRNKYANTSLLDANASPILDANLDFTF